MVTAGRDGTRIIYDLAGDDVGEFLAGLRAASRQSLADADRDARSYLGDADSVESITPDELHRRIQERTVTVIDVRPATEYDAGHLPDALSIPLDQLEARLDELSADIDIVAYCRGPFCVLAPQAAPLLARHGRVARTLSTAYPQWWRAGHPIDEVRPYPRATK